MDIAWYLIVPLALLLLSHAVITVVYDTKILYLRIISMVLPLPFGYFLFKGHARSVLPWFIGVILLAIGAVIGMSAITGLVDGSPVMPQNAFEWKEVLEYSSSISFSFLTGMLLGGMAYASKHRRKNMNTNSLLGSVMTLPFSSDISPDKLHQFLKKIEQYGSTVVAVGTTALSIYTGLKHVI
jgi:hypothetical protein